MLHQPTLMHTLTSQQLRRLDRLAVERLGIPSMVLMENAARGIAEETVKLRLARAARQSESGGAAARGEVLLVCGGGNNGGDGYAAARLLHTLQIPVQVLAAVPPDQLQGDAQAQALILQNMGLPLLSPPSPQAAEAWKSADIIVDALLGTGWRGVVRPPLAGLIARINQAREEGAAVLAVDVPSGLEADTGCPQPTAVRADVTVTLVALKPGFLRGSADEYVGRVVVRDIGIPPQIIARLLQNDPAV